MTLDYLAHVALHEDHSVGAVVRQLGQEHVDDFHHFASGFVNPALVSLELFDALKLKVAARIVVIIDALAIGDRGHAAGMDHLHRQAGT